MILFSFFLIGLVFGYDESKCTPAELPIAMECKTKHKELRSQSVTLDLEDDKNMRKLNTTCEEFLECSTQFKCGATSKDVENIDEAISYCHAVAFHVSPGYLDCVDKVDTKNSTCVQGWNPFPDFEGTEEEKAVKQKEACRNFFGKDGCLEEEISDMCSVELWKDFKMHYLALNKIIKACDFD
ncbi:hypothetical protein B9Z55_016817 [Caenorhabditis nigoni]|uniref:T20D4.11-like domain-containing protein n=1 Tax=Caenorhabditis nigoni TaxID=1611254 RepID=A0A2G5T6D2_9PELO|nr:hypothetical protein B9Z55_016817 [Caenorhabditis nigoni]